MAACAEVPITGRKQLNLVGSAELHAMSAQAYDAFLEEHPLSQDAAHAQMVRRVGGRIRGAVESYFASRGRSDDLRGYEWEFNLVASDEVNAWCMPGGKVVVYTGLLPVARDEAGLATVMGHEIAHAVAHHGNERMSQAMLLEMGTSVLADALAEQPQQTQELFLGAVGLGAELGVLLPYSRLHESEADRLGLIFMAMAGYDPNAAVGFWERMAAQQQGGWTPEFLSTHPSDEKRIAEIRRLIREEAMQHYRPER